jgi:dipeptidyl aminopeptidase/acylaminoacyl peptidase
VAIKVLPPEVAQDTERLGRFRREAHLLASLNHPHIAAIYGLEEADGHPFLALELIDGEDLKERLARVVRRNAKDEQSVWALPVKGGKAEPVLTGFRVDEPQLSPDGRWLAYVSSESGQDEVYVEPFRREGDRVRLSVKGGGQPKWRKDGREIFFVTPTNRLMAVTVRAAGDRVDVSLPSELFEIRGIQGSGYDDYAPSADGQRFLVKVPMEQDRKPELHVVTNWTSLLH